MSITHNTTERNTFCSAVNTALGAAATCTLLVGSTEVATIALNNPAFGTPASGSMTMDNTPVPEDSSATGNASSVNGFEFRTGGTTKVFGGNNVTGVGGGGDLELSKNPIDAADVVQLTSFVYTASP